MIHAAAVDGTILWAIVAMSVAFVVGAGAVVRGFTGVAYDRRHPSTPSTARVAVPAQRVHHRPLVHH